MLMMMLVMMMLMRMMMRMRMMMMMQMMMAMAFPATTLEHERRCRVCGRDTALYPRLSRSHVALRQCPHHTWPPHLSRVASLPSWSSAFSAGKGGGALPMSEAVALVPRRHFRKGWLVWQDRVTGARGGRQCPAFQALRQRWHLLLDLLPGHQSATGTRDGCQRSPGLPLSNSKVGC